MTQPVPASLNLALRQIENLLRAGRHAEAERAASELLRRHSKSPQAWYFLGLARLLQGRPEQALEPMQRAATLAPRFVEARFNLAFILEGLGRLEPALADYRAVVALAPQLADAHNNLGNVLQKLKRHDEARAAYAQAIALRPGLAEYHMNLADALRDMEQREAAVAAYESALRLKPALVEAYVNLAYVLTLDGRYADSAEACRRAIALQPAYFEAHQGLGHALRGLKRFGEAAEAYRRAAVLRPENPVALKDLGMALKAASRYEEALVICRQAMALQPDPDAANLLAGILADMGRMDEALSVYREHLARDPDGLFVMHSSYLFTLSYQERTWPEALLEEALAFGQKVTRKAAHCAKHGNAPDPTRQLRLGLVSGDLGQHPVGFFLANVLESINPEQLEVHAYATAVRHDEVNARLRRSIAHWRDASPDKLDDEALARQIQADGIDILIDLSGHTAHNRLPVFAWKPAPIQVTWLGYLGTTGVGAMDYVLADPYALPVGEENQFVETPWRLPEGYICFSPPELPVEVGQLPASKNGYVTFGCFNNIKKVNQQVVACWAEILKAVPGSRLYLKTRGLDAPEVRAEMTTAFAAHGIAAERLILEGQFASHEEHFRAYQRVDIALDPFPYPGITTSVEALWMGVPVLSLQGDRFISHQGETILHNVGLPDWVARDEADYVAKAAAFAGDLQGLSELRAGLRPRLLASPLCDAPRFARNFEGALRGMWQKWCAEQGARQ